MVWYEPGFNEGKRESHMQDKKKDEKKQPFHSFDGISTLILRISLRAVTSQAKSLVFLKNRRFLSVLAMIGVFAATSSSLQAQESITRTDTTSELRGGLRFSQEQLVFPSTAVGDSSTVSLVVHNDSLRSVMVVALRGGGSAFHVDQQLPLRIPASGTAEIQVVYKPHRFGRIGDTLVVVSEVGEGKVALRGRSPFPLIVPDKESLDFDSVARGSMSERAIVIRNSSINSLAIDSIWTHTPFFHPLVPRATIPGSDSVSIVIGFSPVFSGSFSDTLFIESNARDHLTEIPLTGMSPVPVIAVLTDELRFGPTSIIDSTVRYIRVTDASISSLNLSSAHARGVGFRVLTGSVPPVISGNDTIVVPVLFRPREFGEYADTVTIESDGGTARIPVLGKSPYPMLLTSVDTLIFGDVRKGFPSRRSIVIKNPSINVLRLDSIYTRTKWFTIRAKQTVVGPADSLAVEAAFIPDRFQNFSDTIVIVGNSLNRRVEIPLSGASPLPVPALAVRSLELEPVSLGDSCFGEFIVYNRSSVNDLTVSGVRRRTPFFSLASRLPAVLGRRDSLTLRVRFIVNETSANGFGDHRDTLQIESDGGSMNIAVTGSSPYPSIASASDELDFGTVQKGERATVPLWISNSSMNTVRLDSIGVWHRRVFSLTGMDLPGVIRKGKAQSFTVAFAPDTDNVFVDTLRIYSNAPGSPLKIVLTGRCLSPHNMQTTGTGLPTEFCLFKNYPNPFKGTTTIRFGLPRSSSVSLSVFNTLGQLVAELVNGYLDAGYHTVVFNSAGLSSGLYFYRFQAGDFVDTKKLVVVR
jgi:hypothetical protein